jgi:hypothetical protein
MHEDAKDRECSMHAWGDNCKQNRGQDNPVGKELLETKCGWRLILQWV